MAMISTKISQPPPPPPSRGFYHYPLPSQPLDGNYAPDIDILPRASTTTRRHVICAAILLFLVIFALSIWPSEPDVKIVRMKLNHIKFHTTPRMLIDISLNVGLKIHNADLYTVDYDNLDVEVGYRGKMLGHVRSEHGHVKALGSSYVDANVEFDGVEVLSDVVLLLQDLAKGNMLLDTITEVRGRIGVFFLGFTFKGKVSCEISVNTNNQTIGHQNCFPE